MLLILQNTKDKRKASQEKYGDYIEALIIFANIETEIGIFSTHISIHVDTCVCSCSLSHFHFLVC